MKTAMLPPVRVPEDLRNAAESVLAEGETLSGFIQQSVQQAIDHRRVKAAFDQRGQAAMAHYKRTGVIHPAEEVVARLQAKLDRKRQQLLR